MSKSINVHEACIITKDDKGNLSLVGKAKEALTTLKKNKVSVCILLCDNKKEDVESSLTTIMYLSPLSIPRRRRIKMATQSMLTHQRQMSPSCQAPRLSPFETIGSGAWMILLTVFGEKKRKKLPRVNSRAWTKP